MSPHADVLAILEAAITAVSPAGVFARTLSCEGGILQVMGKSTASRPPRRIFVVGAGKAAGTMAHALESILGKEGIAGGCVIAPYGHGIRCDRIQVLEAGHPVVDEMGLAATGEIVRIVRGAGERDLVVCLLSGGASALFEQLPAGFTLGDLQETTRLLLASGVNIGGINTVRRHLSLVKGGQLARLIAPARCVTLVISDVIGDSPEVIASGPTVPDPSTFADACAVLDRPGLAERVPQVVRRYLSEGVSGAHPETPKAGDAVFERTSYHVLANNAVALESAAREAAARGYRARIVTSGLCGEARDAGVAVASAVRAEMERSSAGDPPFCLLWGGETTVAVRGTGRGGRNQELALAAFSALRSTEGDFSVAAIGTDGTDGPTDAAGAWFDRRTVLASRAAGLQPEGFLDNNDSYTFFARLEGALRTGPTGTNVADLVLALGI
jgi:hydroxypyruvate reductase